MTAYSVVVAERKDINKVTLACQFCGCEVGANLETIRIPDACPSCHKAFDDNVLGALAALEQFHLKAKTAEDKTGKTAFRFEIRQAEAAK